MIRLGWAAAVISVPLSLIAASAYFGPGQFWTIVGVGLTAIGLLGAWVAKLRKAGSGRREEGLSLYRHFVDDLQVELKRLHDLLNEERKENARVSQEKDIKIDDLELKLLALQRRVRELERGQGLT